MATARPNRYLSGLSRNTFLLALASLFGDISTEMLYPILPIFLTQTLKASGGVIGLIEGLGGATQNTISGMERVGVVLVQPVVTVEEEQSTFFFATCRRAIPQIPG